MIEFDMGIVYNSKLKEVKENINRLGSLDFDLTNFKNSVEEIDRKVKEEIKGKYDTNDNNKSIFVYDEMKFIYDKAIKKLDKINNTLKQEYGNYYKIFMFSKKLENDINDVNSDNIEQLVILSTKLLKSLKTSSTIDYEIEKNIVNNVYNLIYKAIKLELIYSNRCELLELVKNDDVDVPFIAKLIREDINNIGDNKTIKNKLLEFNSLDDKNLINTELLSLIISSNDKNLIRKSSKDIIDYASDYKELLDSLEYYDRNKNNILDNISDLNDAKIKNSKKSVKRKLVLTLNALVVSSIIAGGSFVIKNVCKDKAYKTTITKYDSYTDSFDTTEDYIKGKSESISMTEYSPWDNPGYFRDSYTRSVYKYDLDDLNADYSDLSKYLNSNIKDNIKYKSDTEKSTDIPSDYGYGENKYIIEEIKKDLNDYIVKDFDPIMIVLLSSLYSIIVISIDLGILSTFSKDKLKNIRARLREINEDLEQYKNDLDENRKEIDKLTRKIDDLKNIIINEYNKLPYAVRETDKVKDIKKLIKS